MASTAQLRSICRAAGCRSAPASRRPRLTVVCTAASLPRCPFANFGISPAPKNAKPSPMDLADPYSAEANFWLAAGKPGQDVPGKLVSGLHRLYEQGHFLIEDTEHLAKELALKDQAMATRRDIVYAAEPRSLPAQEECLELFLEVLPKYYPGLYVVEGDGPTRSITINLPGEARRVYKVAEFADCPLELCGRLVQEDFALLRLDDEPGPDPKGAKHVMTAACIVFSFDKLKEKLGTTTLSIHAPVPGFEEQLEKVLNRTFTAIQADKPVWRNNWAAAISGDLTHPSYGPGGPGAALEKLAKEMGLDRPPAEALWLKTEYQTLRRLPKTGAILFTIRTLVQPMPEIGVEAAATLHKSLAGMTPELRTYKGVPGKAAEDLLKMLEGIMEREGMAPAQERNALPLAR